MIDGEIPAKNTLTEPPKGFFDALKQYWEADELPFTKDDVDITAFMGQEDVWSVQFKVKTLKGQFYQLDYDDIYEAGILSSYTEE